jgi:CRISPR system Cascade subunit CasA
LLLVRKTMTQAISGAFNLLTSPWLPVRRAKRTQIEWISPAQVAEPQDGPPAAFAWPRPDFDLAAHEFMIGLLAVTFPPQSAEDWKQRFLSPPSCQELAAAFAPYKDAFFLDGDGPRFLQDHDELKPDPSPVEALLIDAPGANTIKLNKDLLVKRGGVRILSRAAAAMALYTLQQFAPSGGAGHRTSLRGGGPLVTLAITGAGEDASAPALWQRIWLNVLKGAPPDANERARVFPWLATTKTSAKKESVSAEDAHPLQAFFGMPRRIRLSFERNDTRKPCDLTGLVDDLVVTGFISEPWGVNYGVWRHPLTPYYKAKTDTLPVHAPEGRIGYRQWLGIVYADETGGRSPATIMKDARDRLSDLADDFPEFGERPLVLAGGFAMDNMKALAFAEAEMPLHLVREESLASAFSRFASILVNSAKIVGSLLAASMRIALFSEKGQAGSDSTILDVPRERLWEETEDKFHRLLDEAVRVLAGEDEDPDKPLREEWRKTLEQTALRIFDDAAPTDAFGEIDPAQVVSARKLLALGLKGYGKYGQSLFKELILTSLEEAKKRGKTSRKSKEETTA